MNVSCRVAICANDSQYSQRCEASERIRVNRCDVIAHQISERVDVNAMSHSAVNTAGQQRHRDMGDIQETK
jgi:hypothetical protein